MAEVQWWAPETPPRHIVAGDILAQSIESRATAGDTEFLRRALLLVEEMASSDDDDLSEVACVSVLESLDEQTLAVVQPMLGRASRAFLESLDDFARRSTYRDEL